MVVRTQAPVAAGKLRRQKHRSIFKCCLAAPDTHSDSGDSAFSKDANDALASQQQPLPRWKQLLQQQEDQQPPGIRTVTISSSATPSDTSNDAAALQQQHCMHNAARSLVTRAAPSTAATYNSTLPSRTVTPLTDFPVVPASAAKQTAAATAVSSSAVGQAFSKASRSIQQCGTGDSPSEIHSDLAADHHHHHHQQQQQQQGGVQAGNTNSPVRRLDSHSVSRSVSGSCHATASSAGSSSSVEGPAAAAAAKACGSGRAEQVIALSPAGPAECELEGPTEEHGPSIPNTADTRETDHSDVPSDSAALDPCAGGLHREISLSPAAAAAATPPPPAAAAVDSSSTSGSNHLDSEESIAAATARTFRFSNSSSFPGLAAAAVDSPSSSTAAASPFAQLSLQKTVANTLLSSARQQQQQSAKRSAATMPASVASFTTAASMSAAAAGVRVSSSSGPAALAGMTSRGSRVSWATASTVLGADPSEVFEVLDPEAASVNDGHKMLKRSASASSVSALASSSSSSTGRNKLQQIRSAMSFGGAAARSKAAAAAAAADSSDQDDQAAAAAAATGSSGFRKVWRRSTHHQATSASLKGPDSSATIARRSKSAHENILAQQQQQQRTRQLSDQGLPPPYPAAAAAAASTAAGRHSSSLGSSGRLASGEAQSSSSSIELGASGSSSSPDLGKQLDRCRISMGSAPPKSGDSNGSTGSLVGLAVTRMHTARSAPLLSSMPTSSSTASSSAPSGLSSMGSMTSSNNSSLAPAATSPGRSSIDLSKASSIQIANAFADAFLAALAAGNTKWASQGTVTQMVDDQAKMLGLDKQLYVGKTAIVRRLNSGMDQLVKMVGAFVDSNNSSTGGDAGKDPDQSNIMSDLATQMPKPLLSVTCPDPKTKPSTVVALYTFKWGIRKFTFRDEFIVKNGQIMRLRRSRS